MVKRRFHHSFFIGQGQVLGCFARRKRIPQESRNYHDREMRERSAMIFGSPSIDPSVLSFQIRLVEEDFDEGGNDLGIEKDRGAAEDFTGDFSLCLL